MFRSARDLYDPSVGRSISEDPIGFAAGDVHLPPIIGRVKSQSSPATAPRSGKHWTDFADEANIIMENAERSRGSDPSQTIWNMARKLYIKAIDRIVKEVGLSKTQRRRLHDEITKQNLSLEEIRQIAEEIKKLYPNK
jgi:hypothetical protein